MKNDKDTVGQLVYVDMTSRDKNGNITEQIRIHPDGREETIIARGA